MHKCSFCGLSEYQVGLYGGPQVMICTECVRVMYEDIGPVQPTPRPPSDRDPIVSVTSTREVSATSTEEERQ